MATDGVNITEDAEMAECEGDKVVTMMDVLQEQQDFEEDANAVLGASDDKNCTYAKGYIKRQAIYACLTCCPDIKTDPTKRAGVCLACSLNCHENHELVELYTKRNFRCDCGNPKFNSHPCQFTPSKPDLNDDNIYNQNFSGLYCTCQRPYPDPESPIEEDMIQCIICEDWLHASHLETVVPANDQYSEMICKGCMDKNEFLHDYSNFAINIEPVDVDILTVNGEKSADADADAVCNGDVDKVVLTNEEAEDKSELEATVPNGDNMDEVKESNDNKIVTREKTEAIDECMATDEETKQNNESEIVDSTEVSAASDKIENNMELESGSQKKQESPEDEEKGEDTQKDDKPIAADNSSESMNTEDNNDEEIQKEDELIPESEQNQKKETEEKMESADAENIVTGPQEQKDEHNPNNTSPHGDIADDNKAEDQLLSDVCASNSENITEETKTEEIAIESSKKEENTACAEENVNKIEGETIEKSTTTEGNPDSETSTVEVPDTSQNKIVAENTDDKTDSVMDAIDELLKDPEASESEVNNELSSEELPTSKENPDSSEIQKLPADKENPDSSEKQIPSDIEMTENDKVLENSDSTDVEITESKKHDENNIENLPPQTTVDSEIPNNIETTENTNKIEPSVDENKAQCESPANVDENSTEIDKEINCDNNSENIAFNETDNTNEVEGDGTSKHETSLNENMVSGPSETTNENKRKLSTELVEETCTKKIKLNVDKCVRPRGVKKVYKGATFWASNFRQKLCTCGECISMYKDLHVLFLTDIDDTVSAYESLGKENVDAGASQYEKGLQALSSLDRIQQINALTEYNKLRDKLLDFLKSFKDRKEIVKEEDIRAFFAGMKPRREPDGVYFCR